MNFLKIEYVVVKYKWVYFYGILLFSSYCNVCACYLDELACKFSTDKSSKIHNYTVIYDTYFRELKNQPIKFMEIGIASLGSVRMWDSYFQHTDAKLIFVDIDNTAVMKCRDEVTNHNLSNRVQSYKIDQANADQLVEFCSQLEDNFDIVIDDGGHRMEQQLTSFKTLFPYIACGGIYIIEDLHTSFLKLYGGGGSFAEPIAGPGTTLFFLKQLVEDVNYIGGVTGLGDVNKCEDSKLKNYYQRHIKSMHFYNSMCFIFKY